MKPEQKKIKKVVIAAGGTGGHIFAAKSIGNYFQEKQISVFYSSGMRTLDYSLYEGEEVKRFKGGGLVGKGVKARIISLCNNLISFIQAYLWLFKLRPQAIIGCGGYVTGPTCLAGFLLGIPVFILEQNSVMGLTNKILSFLASGIFTQFNKTRGMLLKQKNMTVGNPVRDEILHLRQKDPGERLRILVFGGSLGSEQINSFVGDILENQSGLKYSLEIIHQTGKQNNESKQTGKISYQGLEFIHDIAQEYYHSDFIICRSGASTIAELRYVGRPVYLFPLLIHKDRHQLLNALYLKEETLFPVYIASQESTKKERIETFFKALEEIKSQKTDKRLEVVKKSDPRDRILKEISLSV